MRKRQAVRGDVWYMGGKRKKRRQKGGMSLIGAIASSILGTLEGVLVKKPFGGRRMRRRRRYAERQSIVKTKSYTKTCSIT